LPFHNPDIFPLNGRLQELQQIFHFGKLTGQRGPPLFALLAVSRFVGPKEWVPDGTWYTSNQAKHHFHSFSPWQGPFLETASRRRFAVKSAVQWLLCTLFEPRFSLQTSFQAVNKQHTSREIK
jgi:hypothetical protein